MKSMSTCPKCGGNSGYISQHKATIVHFHEFDGEIFDSEVKAHRPCKVERKFCMDCRKDITEHIDLSNGKRDKA